MDTMLELLRKIEMRPELYIGCRDIHRLRAFLSGYSMAGGERDPGYSDDWLWQDFRAWLAERYDDRRASDWATLIADHEPDGQSTDAFFRLLGEYPCWSRSEDTAPHSDHNRRNNMFREMRRTAQQLPKEECYEILRSATSGVLALHGDDGYPYALPISYVLDGESIFLHGAMTGHKVDAMRRCDKVSFCVVQQDEVIPETYSTDYRSVIVCGRARIIDDPQKKLEAIRRMAVRYAPHNPRSKMDAEIAESIDHMMMAEIIIEHITGKESLKLSKKRKAEAQ